MKALRLTDGGVGWLGVPANIGLLLTAPADRPLQGAGGNAAREVKRSVETLAQPTQNPAAKQRSVRHGAIQLLSPPEGRRMAEAPPGARRRRRVTATASQRQRVVAHCWRVVALQLRRHLPHLLLIVAVHSASLATCCLLLLLSHLLWRGLSRSSSRAGLGRSSCW